MANPTTLVRSQRRFYDQVKDKLPLDQSGSTTTFQTGEMVGQVASGYVTHMDDSAPMRFLGIHVKQAPHKFDSDIPTVNDQLDIECPYRITMPLSSGTASRATDIHKIVYAVDSGTVTMDPTGLTYANAVGRITEIVNQDGNRKTLTGTSVECMPFYGHESSYRKLAATGTITLTRFDLNKTIEVTNTATQTINLPAVAQTTPGDTLTFFKTSNDTNAVTLDGNSSETINGATTNATAIVNRYDQVTLRSTGAAWVIDRDQSVSFGQAANVAALAGSLTGTTDGTLADVAAINLSTSDTYSDSAVNTAVNTVITAINLQLKEIQTTLNAEIAALKAANLQASA